ncbi:MAG: DUF2017 family protein [Actinomycetes bacterium]
MSDYRFEHGDEPLLLTLSTPESEALIALARSTLAVVDAPFPVAGDEAVRSRLFPRAYLDPTEDAAEFAFQATVHTDMAQVRAIAITSFIGEIDTGKHSRRGVEVSLDVDAAGRWIGVINDLRLVLGTRIGVSDSEDDLGPSEIVGAGHGERPFYTWMTYLQEELISRLMI